MNIAHLLLGSAREFRDLPALARGTATHLTYRDLWRKVSVMSMHLRGRFGLERGDRVAFAMSNGVEAIEVMYAIWHAGLCAVPMNAKLHAREFAFILENSGARLCFVTPDLAATIAEAAKDAPELKEIVDVTTRSYSFMEVGDPMVLVEAEPTDLAWLFYTSGTTGRPKGAMLTHRNLLAMTLNYFADVDRPSPGGSIVHAAPISHGSGLWNFALLARGAVQVFPESGKYEVPETVELMNCWPDCSIFLAPTMVKRLIEHGSASELRARFVAAGHLWRRTDVCQRPQARPRSFGQQAGADLWPGREPDDHHPSQPRDACRSQAIRAGSSGWRRPAAPIPAWRCAWSTRKAVRSARTKSARSSSRATR